MFPIQSTARRVGVIFLAVACVAATGASRASAAFGGLNGKIAFDRTSPYFPANSEIHSVNPDGSNDVVVTSADGRRAFNPSWSPSGTEIAFASGNQLMTMNPDGTNQQPVLTWTDQVGGVDWSPTGQQFAVALRTCDVDNECRFDVYTVNRNGSALTDITPDVADDRDPAWAPGTLRIAFSSTRSGNADIWSVAPDGSDPVRLTTSSGAHLDPDWSPDGDQIVWTTGQSIYRMNADGTNVSGVTAGDAPAWAPDGSQIAFARSDSLCVGREAIWKARYDGANAMRITDPIQEDCPHSNSDNNPDWQPLPGSYVRPRGATPLRVPLVPAYRSCTAPNRTHGAPLAFSSCAPPVQSSDFLTIGTSEANGLPNVSMGSVLFKVDPSIQNVRVNVSLTDVRKQGTLDDYQGELQLAFTVRLTDKSNGPMNNEPGTVTDFVLDGSVPCFPRSPNGSQCVESTTLGALMGSFSGITGRRMILGIDQVRLFDGGPDGTAATRDDNTLFMTQGVFVP